MTWGNFYAVMRYPRSVYMCFSPDSCSSVSSEAGSSKLKSALFWICGMEKQKGKTPMSPPPEAPTCSLEEEPCMRHLVNANLIVCMSVAVFLIAYWA